VHQFAIDCQRSCILTQVASQTNLSTAGIGLLLFLTASCAERPRFVVGTGCDLTTACSVPLVCRLGRCREECRSNRDCRTGLECLRDEDSLGACALPDESCMVNSDCRPGLVCLTGRCANACETRDDCAPGYDCIEDRPGGSRGCRSTAVRRCAHHSDCEIGERCGPDEHCHVECQGDRDCIDGWLCDLASHICCAPGGCDPVIDGGTIEDGGAPPFDAAPFDAPPSPDAGPSDGGSATTAAAPSPRLAAGYDHNCANVGGRLVCWGYNLSGQLGVGSLATPVATPTEVWADGAELVTAGFEHTCAVRSGALYCWGDHSYGQLGSGAPATAGPDQTRPVAVAMPLDVTWLSAGKEHTCAVASTGAVWCWGANGAQQLGDGTTMPRNVPTLVDLGGLSVVEVAARSAHTCARVDDGTLRCWGANGYGQLGDGTTAPSSPPVSVLGITDAREVLLGSNHSCARTADGAVWCWGDNADGRLGDGTFTSRTRPTRVDPTSAMPAAVELAAGFQHTCARAIDGTVWCWGDNVRGQLGVPLSTFGSSRPLQVAGVEGATELSGGDLHTCARVAGDAVLCWGADNRGQLGDGSAGGDSAMAQPVVW
jgi:alpha-tubulin suppressor-like RCC1 family protein